MPAVTAPVLLGLDLSLSASAAVALPADWAPGDWDVPSLVVPAVEVEEDRDAFHARRTGVVANALLRFAVEHGVTDVYCEGYAYGRQNAREALAELGGVVKDYFLRRGRDVWSMTAQTGEVPRPPREWVVRPVNMASARKTLLGKVPSKKTSGVPVKDHVNSQLAKMGARFKTMDEGDAFVVANHARMLLGLSHVGVSE